jgi:hypothetical protein
MVDYNGKFTLLKFYFIYWKKEYQNCYGSDWMDLWGCLQKDIWAIVI